MHYMLKEILEQPKAIKRVIENNMEVSRDIKMKLKSRDIRFILFCARGSSDNACTFGKYFLEMTTGIPSGLVAPSLFSSYKAKFNLKNVLIFGVTQSGETPEILRVLDMAKKYGAYTVGITNNPRSTISKIAEDLVCLYAGEEKAVPATKTYTAQLSTFYLLGWSFVDNSEWIEKFIDVVPSTIQLIIQKYKSFIEEIAKTFKFVNSMIVLGRGLNYATALETSLKLKETCYIKSEALSASDFLHGPIAIMREKIPVLVYLPKDPVYEHIKGVVERLKKEFDADMIIVSENNEIKNYTKNLLKVPKLDYVFTPIVYIVLGQMLAYYTSITKGINPDSPKGLKKITVG